jgi:hypothetical protein
MSMNRFVNLCCLFIFSTLTGCGQDFSIISQPDSVVAVDSLILPIVDKIDILSVVDTSCSMMDGDLNRVADGMVNLRHDIEPITQDYQFGFIDAASNSTFYGPLTPTETDIDFRMIVNTFNMQNGAEVPFASLYDYITTDGSFIREGSDLLIFIFTDEKEQTAITAQEMHNWLISRWPEKRIDVVSIVPTIIQADGMHATCGEIDQKYTDFSHLFGRETIDLCFSDWGAWLSESSFLTTADVKILLTAEPIASSIVVYVNHTRTHDFSYDENENTVHLDFTPDPGSLIEVGYKVLN